MVSGEGSILRSNQAIQRRLAAKQGLIIAATLNPQDRALLTHHIMVHMVPLRPSPLTEEAAEVGIANNSHPKG